MELLIFEWDLGWVGTKGVKTTSELMYTSTLISAVVIKMYCTAHNAIIGQFLANWCLLFKKTWQTNKVTKSALFMFIEMF